MGRRAHRHRRRTSPVLAGAARRARPHRVDSCGGARDPRPLGRLDGAVAIGTVPEDAESEPESVIDVGRAPAPVLSTGLFDYRRTPRVIAATANASQLGVAVDPVLQFIGPESCAAVTVDGAVVTSANPDLPVIPASTQQLLTASAALDILGPDSTFTTSVAAAPIVDGVVDGDVYLVGGGDPLLTSDDFPIADDPLPVTSPTSFDTLANGLVAAGVSTIRGSVVGDGSRYDDEFVIDEWGDGVAFDEAGPYDALLVNDSRIAGRFEREEDPNLGAAAEFVRLLEARGIRVDGGPDVGTAPADASVVATVESVPMSDVVAEMLLTSDNNTAEMLVKEMGLVAGGAGTRSAGLNAMFDSLESQGVSMDGVVLRDGSGLSARNRVTCSAVLDVLHLARGGPIDAGLPLAAISGTLADEFRDSPMVGRLRAKTGTLANPPVESDPPAVKALAGYVDPVSGPGPGTIEFVLIANTPDVTDQNTYRPLWKALGERFATYPSGPAADSLGPR
jgi:D-alanyl-D-alanine carboxypeptidase/D-alanyl-D-alanine-endopeptidase (penicillin-binding protein 4)